MSSSKRKTLYIYLNLAAPLLAQMYASDCDALAASFPKAGIPGGTNCCSGTQNIVCNENNRVSIVRFDAQWNANYTVNGPLPYMLSSLTQISTLHIINAKVTGSIPEWLCGFQNMNDLDLLGNRLEGEIPGCLFTPAMGALNLAYNNLNGSIPAELGNAKLFTLYLAANQLTGSIPSSFTSLSTLRDANFNGNSFSGIMPSGVESMTNLVGCYFDTDTGLCKTYVPRNDVCGYTSLPNCTDCDFLNSKFPNDGIAGGIACCSENANIQCDGNVLNLGSRNIVNGELPTLTELTEIGILTLRDAGFSGLFPLWICSLTKLKLLDMFGNALKGEIPGCLFTLKSLTHINLSGSKFNGSIPQNIGDAVQLKKLYLDSNELSGPIPEAITNLVELVDLNLSRNRFKGPVPLGIPKMSKLLGCGLTENSGLCKTYVPPTDICGYSIIPNCTDCDLLSISFPAAGIAGGNSCCSGNPSIICNGESRITVFDYRSAVINGPLPSYINQLDQLNSLSFGWAQVRGALPAWICDLKKLSNLYLYRNFIDGELPACLFDIPSLAHLNIFDNQLSGPIPPNIGNAQKLVTLYLSGNHLNGSLPESLASLPNLEVLCVMY